MLDETTDVRARCEDGAGARLLAREAFALFARLAAELCRPSGRARRGGLCLAPAGRYCSIASHASAAGLECGDNRRAAPLFQARYLALSRVAYPEPAEGPPQNLSQRPKASQPSTKNQEPSHSRPFAAIRGCHFLRFVPSSTSNTGVSNQERPASHSRPFACIRGCHFLRFVPSSTSNTGVSNQERSTTKQERPASHSRPFACIRVHSRLPFLAFCSFVHK